MHTAKEWSFAEDNVRKIREEYRKLGIVGMFGEMILTAYLHRYEAGERTEDLYESMITAK